MSGTQYVGTQVRKDILRKFENHFPMDGAKSWFIRECFAVCAELAEEGELGAPRESIESIVRRTTEEM